MRPTAETRFWLLVAGLAACFGLLVYISTKVGSNSDAVCSLGRLVQDVVIPAGKQEGGTRFNRDARSFLSDLHGINCTGAPGRPLGTKGVVAHSGSTPGHLPSPGGGSGGTTSTTTTTGPTSTVTTSTTRTTTTTTIPPPPKPICPVHQLPRLCLPMLGLRLLLGL